MHGTSQCARILQFIFTWRYPFIIFLFFGGVPIKVLVTFSCVILILQYMGQLLVGFILLVICLYIVRRGFYRPELAVMLSCSLRNNFLTEIMFFRKGWKVVDSRLENVVTTSGMDDLAIMYSFVSVSFCLWLLRSFLVRNQFPLVKKVQLICFVVIYLQVMKKLCLSV